MELLELTREAPPVSWMNEEAAQKLEACFDMELETVPAGETRQTGYRFAFLLRGRGTVRTEEGEAPAGAVFGLRRGEDGHRYDPVETEFRAETECRVLWLSFDAAVTACYAACWFHARLFRELEALEL